MKTKQGVELHNYFTFRLRDARTGELKQTAKAENVVLNNLFNQLNTAGVRIAGDYTRTPSLLVGTGVGTPSISDTQLFNRLAYKDTAQVSSIDNINSSVIADGIVKSVFTCTFTELEALGNLTEVGLGNLPTTSGVDPTYVYTHAMITDSEGNPITITKTDADILDCSATVYVKISTVGDAQPLRLALASNSLDNLGVGCAPPTNDVIFSDGAYPGIPAGDTYLNLSRGGGTASPTSINSAPPYNGYLRFYGISAPPPVDDAAFYNFHGGQTTQDRVTATHTNGVTRWSSKLIQSSAGNLGTDTWLIKGIYWGRQYWISLPNHTLYPPKELTFTLTGDGTTSDFNLPIPELMTSNVVIKIDDAQLPSTDYTFSGKNFQYAQAWVSADSKYVVDWGMRRAGTTSAQRILPIITFPITGWSNIRSFSFHVSETELAQKYLNNPIVYDFKEPRTVNTLRGTVTWPSMGVPVELDYSTDGTAWVNAATLNLASAAGEATFAPISARYWRLNKVPITGRTGSNDETAALNTLNLGFDNVQPTVHFNTPPAANAAITITAYCEYPMKNANWRIDPCTLDIYFQRSGS